MTAKHNVLVINGPNLNRLGLRQPEIYGSQTLNDIIESLTADAEKLNIELNHFQSNAEHELIERIHQAYQQADFIIINPAAYTHTSVAIRDALLSIDVPFYEVHLSNIHSREPFRHHSYLSDIAEGVICGFGPQGYAMALGAAAQLLAQNK
ncbi:type II 3-dehydroquinate dehydratase [Thalassotalea sp. PS06]|uniref:type II 3-dehydroquinate dehydratase n=1 Tax=Thalassotalea sp. PS06 TaxID=2594005 RepID=UPI001162639D|nr:type II 3-dehydroquinate dehydratase [Thalassotalea sp. PS06]QDP02457.1 type II 3-dehydroquinate dehydratase [Thalassotalea sp. PS06]